MKEENKTLILDNDYGYTEIGYAKDLYDSLWDEISEYISNNEYCAKNMSDHFQILTELESIIEDEDETDYDRKTYQLEVENGYPNLSVLKVYDIDSTEAKDELYVYVRETQGINLYVVECMADGCECYETVDAVNLYGFLRDFETKHSNRNVIIKMI